MVKHLNYPAEKDVKSKWMAKASCLISKSFGHDDLTAKHYILVLDVHSLLTRPQDIKVKKSNIVQPGYLYQKILIPSTLGSIEHLK